MFQKIKELSNKIKEILKKGMLFIFYLQLKCASTVFF